MQQKTPCRNILDTNFDLFFSLCPLLQNEMPLFSQDGHKFFFTRAIPQGGRGKFFHISMSTSMVSKWQIILMRCVLGGLVQCCVYWSPLCVSGPAQHQHRHTSVPDVWGLGHHQHLGVQSSKEPHVRRFDIFAYF